MPTFKTDNFKEIVQKFYNINKRILQNRPLSTKESKIKEFIHLLINGYNGILSYTSLHIHELPTTVKEDTCRKIWNCIDLLVRCFGKLDCRIRVPCGVGIFELVDEKILSDSDSDLGALKTEKDIRASIEETDQENIIVESKTNNNSVQGHLNAADNLGQLWHPVNRKGRILACAPISLLINNFNVVF